MPQARPDHEITQFVICASEPMVLSRDGDYGFSGDYRPVLGVGCDFLYSVPENGTTLISNESFRKGAHRGENVVPKWYQKRDIGEELWLGSAAEGIISAGETIAIVLMVLCREFPPRRYPANILIFQRCRRLAPSLTFQDQWF